MAATSKSKLNTPFEIQYVHLKVADLEKMTHFYQGAIGLKLLKQEDKKTVFAAQESDEPILILEEIDGRYESEPKAGLYHMAFLLPTRKDLANELLWLNQAQVPLVGAADHSYSEAIYLKDPEGNDIEIYVDKDKSEWNILEDGQITGVTDPMDVDAVLAMSDGKWQGIAPGSTMGHVHLYVSNLQATEEFYYEILGFGLKYDFGRRAKFMAVGEYHHHLGLNEWKGTDMPALDEDEYGMDHYAIKLASEEDYQGVKERLVAHSYPFTEEDNIIKVADPSGINIQVTY